MVKFGLLEDMMNDAMEGVDEEAHFDNDEEVENLIN